MRTLLTLGLVLGLTMVTAQSADAKKKQTSKAKAAATKTATKKSTAAKTTTKKAEKAETAAPAIETQKATPAASTNTASAPTAPAKPAASKWGLSFYTENTLNVDKVSDGTVGEKGGEPLYTYNYPRIDYKASDRVKFSLLQEFESNLGFGETDTSETTILDTQFRLSHSDLATLPGGLKVNGQLRFYMPVSTTSQDRGQILLFRPLLTISKPMDKLTLSYNLMPRLYLQQFKTFDVKNDDGSLKLNPDGSVVQKGNSYLRVQQWLGAEYAINDIFTVAGSVGYYQGWWYSDPSVGVKQKRVDGMIGDLYTDINVAKWLSLSIGVQTEDPMGNEGAVLKSSNNQIGSSATKTIFDARALEYKFAATFSLPL